MKQRKEFSAQEWTQKSIKEKAAIKRQFIVFVDGKAINEDNGKESDSSLIELESVFANVSIQFGDELNGLKVNMKGVDICSSYSLYGYTDGQVDYSKVNKGIMVLAKLCQNHLNIVKEALINASFTISFVKPSETSIDDSDDFISSVLKKAEDRNQILLAADPSQQNFEDEEYKEFLEFKAKNSKK